MATSLPPLLSPTAESVRLSQADHQMTFTTSIKSVSHEVIPLVGGVLGVSCLGEQNGATQK